jgi:hypothetical protein
VRGEAGESMGRCGWAAVAFCISFFVASAFCCCDTCITASFVSFYFFPFFFLFCPVLFSKHVLFGSAVSIGYRVLPLLFWHC